MGINSLTVSPNRYWLCAATGASIKIWDLEGKIIVDELKPEVLSTSTKAEAPSCTSLAWSADGQTLFAGYTDNLIRVWQVTVAGTRWESSHQEVSSSAAPKEKALPQVELDLRAVCPLHSEQQALCAHRLHCHCWATCPCAYAALPDFCGCNLNKL